MNSNILCCLKVTLHIPALVKYVGNDNALALDGENQHMLFDDQAFVTFRYVVRAVADFRVFRKSRRLGCILFATQLIRALNHKTMRLLSVGRILHQTMQLQFVNSPIVYAVYARHQFAQNVGQRKDVVQPS